MNGLPKKDIANNTKKAYTSSIDATEHSVMVANSNNKTKNDFCAAVMAVEDAEIDFEKYDKDRIGVIIGSGIGGMWTYHTQQHQYFVQHLYFVPQNLILWFLMQNYLTAQIPPLVLQT